MKRKLGRGVAVVGVGAITAALILATVLRYAAV